MLSVLLETIQTVGDYIARRAQTPFEILEKEGINNLVTAVDREAEQLIVAALSGHFPDHGFVGEEYGVQYAERRYQWIIDPIDGTANYAHHIPLYCVSIALAVDGVLQMGAIYNPVLKELFHAEKGKGAFLNGKRIGVSGNADFSKSFLVTGFPYVFPEGIDVARIFAAIVNGGLPIRRLGSAALDLAYVACGRFDGFWEYNLKPWDIAAGYLIVAEAGGRVTDFGNEEGHYDHKETLATNGLIHDALLGVINAHQ